MFCVNHPALGVQRAGETGFVPFGQNPLSALNAARYFEHAAGCL